MTRRETTPSLLRSIAWICVTAPEGFTDPAKVLAMIEEATADSRNNDAEKAQSLAIHGAALFRAEKWDAAANQLEKGLDLQAESPSAWLFLAMTEHQRGRTDEARTWLEKAAASIERERKEKQKPWGERVYLDVLLREARQMLGITRSDAPCGSAAISSPTDRLGWETLQKV
jgi:tetratricopeptide (TPR) repeat protein